MTDPSTESIHVSLGADSYDIFIGPGLLDNAGDRIKAYLQRPFTVVVSDESVWAAQGAKLSKSLTAAGIKFETVIFPSGEETKSFANLQYLTEALLGHGIERQDAIIAFGGGVIGDLTGFAASILRRGCQFIQIPTTLLAQVDSAVGGKTAINASHGKNLIGSFHQPAMVLTDTTSLDTLDLRHIRAGYAEILKYALLGDAQFFDWLEENAETLIKGDQTKRVYAVAHSCRAKAAIVADDEKERGRRALLNLGHTFGHALEAAYGFSDQLLHGEGVAVGMALAFDYAVQINLCTENESQSVKRHLRRIGAPDAALALPNSNSLSATQLTELMMQDKKVEQGRLTLILPHRIGDAHIVKDASIDSVREFLADHLQN